MRNYLTVLDISPRCKIMKSIRGTYESFTYALTVGLEMKKKTGKLFPAFVGNYAASFSENRANNAMM